MTGVFHEIYRPGRLVFAAAAEDRDGNPLLEWVSTVSLPRMAARRRLDRGGKRRRR